MKKSQVKRRMKKLATIIQRIKAWRELIEWQREYNRETIINDMIVASAVNKPR